MTFYLISGGSERALGEKEQKAETKFPSLLFLLFLGDFVAPRLWSVWLLANLRPNLSSLARLEFGFGPKEEGEKWQGGRAVENRKEAGGWQIASR